MKNLALHGGRLARWANGQVILLLSLTILSRGTLAQARLDQARDDHLQPVTDYFSAYHFENEYYALIRRYLLDSLKDSPMARVVVRPSFAEEYVISVDSANQVYALTYCRANKSIWSFKQKERLGATSTKIAIGRELAQVLNKLFFEAVAQTRYPKRRIFTGPKGEQLEEFTVGADGTTYVFIAFTYGHGVRSGQTWSPPKGSRMNDLVGISDAMVRLVADATNRKDREGALLKQCQTLYEQIAELR